MKCRVIKRIEHDARARNFQTIKLRKIGPLEKGS